MTDTLTDPEATLLADVHARGNRQIEAAQRIAAERDIALLRAEAAERRCAELEHLCRELRKANESWQIRCEDQQRTIELPKIPASEPAPPRRRRRRH